MEEEEAEATTPFWAQSSSFSSHWRRRSSSSSSSSSSIFLNSGVLIIILPIIAIIFIFIIIPSFLSFTSQFVKPNLVKKSWDYLNFLLVLFAILCGIFGRKTDLNLNDEQRNQSSSSADSSNLVPNVVRSESLVGESPRTRLIKQQLSQHSNFWSSDSNHHFNGSGTGNGLMRRNSSSYPDLRQESLWVPSVDRRRFYDDFDVHSYRYEESSSNHHVQRSHFPQTPQISRVYQDHVDKFEVNHHHDESQPPLSESSPLEPPSPPPPPPLPLYQERKTEQKQRRTFQTIAKSSEDYKHSEYTKVRSPTLLPPPPAPPPPPPLQSRSRSNRSETKGKAKDIKSTLASLYNQRKRKKKQRSKENFDDIFRSDDADTYNRQFRPPPSPPPPPPPPPPPTSVFHQLFKKSNKTKRIHSISSTKQSPPPPPPPPPKTPPQFQPVDSPRRRKPVAAGRPPLPTKMNNYYPVEDIYLNSGNQSPLIPMPPPPPPPPFKMPELKFVVRGDFVRIHSSQNSRSTSPDLDYVDSPTNQNSSVMDGQDSSPSTPFCPSPDVNVLNDKANSFIARFRAGLKLEKMNSIKQKEEMGTSSGTSPAQAQAQTR